MTIPDDNRRRFEMLGEERLAAALGTGRFQLLGLTEDMKPDAMEWLAELKTNRASEQKQKLRWAKIEGWSTMIGVGVAIAAIIVAIWLAK